MTLRHLVLFRTLPGVTDAQIDAALDEIRSLDQTGELLSITAGRDVSHRGEFDVGLCADFSSREQLARYLVHPQHVRLVERTLPGVFQRPWQVVDYQLADAAGEAP